MTVPLGIKFQSYAEFWYYLPEEERMITDILRQIVLQNIPASCREKLAYNVPYYYGKRRICLIWPASLPRGGFKKGVMLGFCYGNRLPDKQNFLDHGTNKQLYYKIFYSPSEINEKEIIALLKEALYIDSELS